MPKFDSVYKIFYCIPLAVDSIKSMTILWKLCISMKKTHFADLSKKTYDMQLINAVLELFDITVISESTGH